MKFVVHGKVQGKQRARTFYNSKIGKMQSVTPEKTKSYEDLIRWSYKAAGGKFLGDAPITLDIFAVYDIPSSWSNKKRIQATEGILLPLVKVDVDNCAKEVLDALNGVAFSDDKQVVDLHICKRYGDNPRLEITVDVIR